MSLLLTINTDQLQLFGRGTRKCLKIRNRGLLFHCLCFMTLKHAHFWHKTKLNLLIKLVFAWGLQAGVRGLGAAFVILRHRSPPSFLALHSKSPSFLFPSARAISSLGKDTVQSNLFFLLSFRGTGVGGEGRTKWGESKEGRVVCKGRVLINEEEWVSTVCKPKSREGEKEALICLNRVHPGLILDTNRATGKLCTMERRRVGGKKEFGGQMYAWINKRVLLQGI